MKYGRFFAMIASSTIVMFGLMYLNTYLLSHVFWSETRAYMALIMGAAMAVVMLAFMLSMYASRIVNAGIFLGAIVVFGGALWLVRSQATIDDRAYMSAMIPHHSIAIMTSSRAQISDPRVRKLADEIIYAQDKEIAEMRYLIAVGERPDDGSDPGSQPTAPVSLEEALSTAEIATLDPQFLSREEISNQYASGPVCTFTYTEDSAPVLALGEEEGTATALVKISGDLVRLSAAETANTAAGPLLTSPGVSLQVSGSGGDPLPTAERYEPRDADLVFELDAGLRAGYRGYFGCSA